MLVSAPVAAFTVLTPSAIAAFQRDYATISIKVETELRHGNRGVESREGFIPVEATPEGSTIVRYTVLIGKQCQSSWKKYKKHVVIPSELPCLGLVFSNPAA